MSGAGEPDALSAFGPATRAWFEASFDAPTEVQARGWAEIAAGRHALLIAPTGSGKTLAAFLAGLDAVSRLPADAPDGVRVLYISPLKALAVDIERNLRAPLVGIRRAAERLGAAVRQVTVDVRTGDTPQRERQRFARRPGDLLVTTPESLYLLLTSQAREALRTVTTVIVDEVHVLAPTKRGAHLAVSLERLAALTDVDPQRIGLSATQRPPETAARWLGGDRPVALVDTSAPPRLDLEIVVPVDDMERPDRGSVDDLDAPAPALAEADDDAWDADPEDLDGLGDDPWAAAAGLPAEGRDTPGGIPDARTPKGLVHGRTPDAAATPALQSGIWPAIHPRLLALIRAHRSTIVFVNSRLLCERLAAALNALAGEEIVSAHHGSLSHEARARIEEDLKAGRLPALVATSSLELGIDMGAIDLVVLVESPGAVSRGLQRVGRAGHQVGAVSSGRIFPKFRGDLVECVVVAEAMAEGDIEPIAIPRNPLDVLSQQIVAVVCQEPWEVGALHALIRRAAPYAELSLPLLVATLDMLTGKFPSDAFADLTPSLVWDRATDVLTPRRGARLLAVLNAGTIPDRGLYRVRLGSDGPKLGELDEEYVYESREGDVIVLGASSWRIEEITADTVVVKPAPGQPGRLPFWRGERPGRPLELGRRLGAFLAEIAALPPEEAEARVAARAPVDPRAARNVVAYVTEQREATGVVPGGDVLVVERFRDELGDWRVCVLSPLGTRVHAPWALALDALLSTDAGFSVQSVWSDDGIALRFADVDGELPDPSRLFPDPDELEDLVVGQLQHSALFATRFREAAGRALLLPRRKAKGRTPLWMQRKKAASLMATALRFPRFPLVLETYRECLQDVFDLPALRALLAAVRDRRVRVEVVDTASPSPFARGLVFQMVASYLYDGDAPLAERRAAALTVDRALLRELLGDDALRELLAPEAIDEVEATLQGLTPARAARHVDALHDLLRRVGDLSAAEVAARCDPPEDAGAWLETLVTARRAVPVRLGGETRYLAIEDAGRYRDALGLALPQGLPAAFTEAPEDPLTGLVARYARTHGPFVAADVAARFELSVAVVEAVLRGLEARRELLSGQLRPGGTGIEWCDDEVLQRIRRLSLARLRAEVEPVGPEVLADFLPAWHGVGRGVAGLGRLREVVEQLEGAALPWSALEGEILPARVSGYQPVLLDQLGAMGEVVWVGRGALGPHDGRVALMPRERASCWIAPESVPEGPVHAALLAHLDARGACFLAELQGVAAAAGADLSALQAALWDLVWAGLLTNDTLQPLRGLGRKRPSRASARGGAVGRGLRPGSRGAIAGGVLGGGRWSRTDGPSLGPSPDPTEIALARAWALLERHGVVSSQTASTEAVPGGFTAIYPVFRELEASGRVRRGHFVDGLGGAQFALPGAVDRLRQHRDADPTPRLLAATDPASPWGALVPWPPTLDPSDTPKRQAGATVALVGGTPILWLGPGDRTLLCFRAAFDDPARLDAAVAAIRDARGYRSLRPAKIDGVQGAEHPQLDALLRAGFRRDHLGLVLTGRS